MLVLVCVCEAAAEAASVTVGVVGDGVGSTEEAWFWADGTLGADVDEKNVTFGGFEEDNGTGGFP